MPHRTFAVFCRGHQTQRAKLAPGPAARAGRLWPLALALLSWPNPPLAHCAPPGQTEPAAGGQAGSSAAEGPTKQTPPGTAWTSAGPAYAGKLSIAWAELDQLLLDRYALAPEGERGVLFLARGRLLDRLADEAGVGVSAQELRAEIASIESRLAAEKRGDLTAQLTESGITRATFEQTLRRSMLQERLARRALGIPADRPVPTESQELWLDAEITKRGVERFPRPFPKEGLACVGEDLWIGPTELSEVLRAQVAAETQREALAQLLLLKALEQRLAQRPAAELEAAIDAELASRRSEAAADPAYRGVPFEDLLAARGRDLVSLRRDPALRVAALATYVVGIEVPEDQLERVYRADQERFDGRLGAAVQGRVLFLAAGGAPGGPLRTFEAARAEMALLSERAASEPAFAALAKERSEDLLTRPRGGDLGFITRAQEGVLPEVRDALFSAAQRGHRGLLGPLDLPGGLALLWVGDLRPTPSFAELRPRLRQELERHLLEGLLPAEAIHTYVDAELRALAGTPR
jgi:PPIC-type PPIASE domain